jgi:uncharacterized protein
MSIKNKLNRLKSHISTNNETESISNVEKTDHLSHHEKWKEEGVVPYYIDNDFCLIKKTSYPVSYVHGHYSLADFILAVKFWNESDFHHPLSAKGFKPEQLFFFDTETTGLGGGAGNSIFILGHAAFSDDEVILTQHILPHPGAEIPLYDSFLKQVDYKTLVTYNGKSFDWPRVKTQHTLIREHVPKLPDFGHFDLFHAAKRLWKYRMERMKLSIIEKEVLGFTRIDDIPGHLAPLIYFDYVERKDPEGMLKILKHNEMDILSLITLYTHLSFQLLEIDPKQSMQDKYQLGKWFYSLGDIPKAQTIYHQIVQSQTQNVGEAHLKLGYIYKKQKDFVEALNHFIIVVKEANNPVIQLEACLEAAKLLEHQRKDFACAIKFCDIALNLINQGVIHKKQDLVAIEKRRNRILKKNFLGKRKIHGKSPK